MAAHRPARVLMIALDAAEPRLIEQWMDEGVLPHLARLRARGVYGRLASTSEWLSGSVWSTFYTGTLPSDHGIFNLLQWRADRMAHARPTPEWLPARPFWRKLSSAGPRVIALDIPMVYSPEPMNGVEISGWATHDRLAPPASSPPSLMRWVRREFGPPHLKKEGSSHRRPDALLRLRDELIRATDRVTALGVALMQRESWELLLCGFSALHRGGHMLWNLPGNRKDLPPRYHAALSKALRDVYTACDTAVGRLVESAGDDATVLVFSLHGMGPNTSRAEIVLPKMLSRVLAKQGAQEPVREQGSRLERWRRRIPVEWRSSIRRRLPVSWQDRLTAFWRMGRIDWSVTPAICQIADAQGCIRINLRRREAAGIVEPGSDYDRLCEEIVEGLHTFVDADTGEPVVQRVERIDHVYPDGARRDRLPDLLVCWSDTPADRHRVIRSPHFGSIPWPTPGTHPDGRSGNHGGEGFLIAAGDHIPPGSTLDGAHIVDLAPTVYALFGLPKPPEMRGKFLPLIDPH
ncbi:MAG: alkaline phosphatase family protein [Gemmatimonadales bacterium]